MKLAVASGGALLAVVLSLLFMGGSGQASSATAISGVPAEYVEVILRGGQVCDEITPSILAAQIETESAWDPNAGSSAGAQGISQFMPTTWATRGMDGDGDGVADIWNPIDAIWSQANFDCSLVDSVKLLLDAGKAEGDVVDLALAGYNAGLGAVEQYGGIPPYEETQNYVDLILERAEQYVTTSGGTASGNAVVARAQHYLGTPYVWSAESPSGVDCSGLVYLIYQDLGMPVPRLTANGFATWSQAVSVPEDELEPGDLIAFRWRGAAEYHHVAIYVGTDGNGTRMIIEAPDVGSVVQQVPLDTQYRYQQEWKTFRFVFDTDE